MCYNKKKNDSVRGPAPSMLFDMVAFGHAGLLGLVVD